MQAILSLQMSGSRISFTVPHHIDEEEPAFKFCIEDIIRRIKNMGPVVDSNEAMRCEYISTILHTAVSILGGLVILPQMNVSGEESSGRVDYAIKKILDDLLEEIICITEGKQNQPGKGVAQNLMQCRSSCEVSNTMSSLHSTILISEYTNQSSSVNIDEFRYAQEKA